MRLNRYRMLELMDNAGYRTQRQLADALGVTRQTMSLWMQGGGFQKDRVADLCRLLDCTPNDILVLDAPKAAAPASILEPA
jgi:DNA-binding Xre family transcriptional regulator